MKQETTPAQRIIDLLLTTQESETSIEAFERAFGSFIDKRLKEVNSLLKLPVPDQRQKHKKSRRSSKEGSQDTRLLRLMSLLSKENSESKQIPQLLESLRRDLRPKEKENNFFDQQVLISFLEELSEIYHAAFLSGNPEVFAALQKVFQEQEQRFVGSIDLLSFVKLFVYFSPHQGQYDMAGDVSTAVLAINNRSLGVHLEKPRELRSPLVMGLELSIKVSVLADALGLKDPVPPAQHARVESRNEATENVDVKGMSLFAFIDLFETSENSDYPASYSLILADEQSRFFRLIIQYEAETWKRAIQQHGKHNAATFDNPNGSGVMWWEQDPFREESNPLQREIKSGYSTHHYGIKERNPERVAKEMGEIIDLSLQYENNDSTLQPEFFDAWWRFKFPGFSTPQTLEQLKAEAYPGVHPTTKRGEVYWLEPTHTVQQELIQAGLLGLQFRLNESAEDLTGDSDFIEVTFLMLGNKSFSFLIGKNLSSTNLPEYMADKEDEISYLVIFILSKIRNRQLKARSITQNAVISTDGATIDDLPQQQQDQLSGNDDLPTHLRVLIGQAPNREWLNEESELNQRVKRRYGITLKDLNFHFVMAQVLGEQYLIELPDEGVKHLLKSYIERKLALLLNVIDLSILSKFGAQAALGLVTDLRLSSNARETHAILGAILEIDTPSHLALLTFVETHDDSRLPPRKVTLDNAFDEVNPTMQHNSQNGDEILS